MAEKRVSFRYKNGFETEYRESIADKLEKKGEGKIIMKSVSRVVNEVIEPDKDGDDKDKRKDKDKK